MLWDYAMHHRHLSRNVGQNAFVERSDWLLFVIVADEDAYFVDVRRHSDPDRLQWVRQDPPDHRSLEKAVCVDFHSGADGFGGQQLRGTVQPRLHVLCCRRQVDCVRLPNCRRPTTIMARRHVSGIGISTRLENWVVCRPGGRKWPENQNPSLRLELTRSLSRASKALCPREVSLR